MLHCHLSLRLFDSGSEGLAVKDDEALQVAHLRASLEHDSTLLGGIACGITCERRLSAPPHAPSHARGVCRCCGHTLGGCG